MIVMDYMNMKEAKKKGKNRDKNKDGDKDQDMKEEEEQGERRVEDMPILAARDRQSGFKFAHVVPKKGWCQYASDRVQNDIRVLGHKELIIKCDQEPSVLALREQIKQGPFTIKDEESPVKESQSNGLIENTIRTEQGQIRTIRDGLEARYGRKIGREHHSLPWFGSMHQPFHGWGRW